MARLDSLIKLRGTYDGLTFVKSSTYGEHVRAKRGTHKEAKMNDACKKQSEKLVQGNALAKIIKDAINSYRGDFREASMWWRIVSRVQEHYVNGTPFDFTKMVPFEVHTKYPLARLVDMHTTTTVSQDRSTLNVTVPCDEHPNFKGNNGVDAYRVSVIAIFPDENKKWAHTEAMVSDLISLTETPRRFSAQIPVPNNATTYLICLRIDGSWKERLSPVMGTTGMRIEEAGVISPI